MKVSGQAPGTKRSSGWKISSRQEGCTWCPHPRSLSPRDLSSVRLPVGGQAPRLSGLSLYGRRYPFGALPPFQGATKRVPSDRWRRALSFLPKAFWGR